MTDHHKTHDGSATRALQLLDEAWAYYDMTRRPVTPAAPSGYDLPDAA